MKKLFCILVVGISLAGCMREISDAGPESEAKAAKEVSGTAVSVEDALAEMYYVMGELYGTTRSVSVDVGDVLTVTGEQIRRATRSSEDTALPENVLYLVNFGEDEGYAVLGADQRLPSVIAITEQGSISVADFDLSNYVGAYSLGGDGIVSLDDLWYEEDEDYYLGIRNDITIMMMTKTIFDFDLGSGSSSLPHYEYGPWEAITTYTRALMETKWFQGPPFNDRCPEGNKAEYSNGRYPAGCVAIAVAQILAHNDTPTAQSLFGVTSTWEDFRGYNFSAPLIDTCSTARDTLLRNEIAGILRSIGNGCNMIYGFFGDFSFATPNSAKKYFRDKAKYKNVEKFTGYEENAIVSCLSKGYPVFVGAISDDVDGHAWVIDGYLKQSRAVKKTNNTTGKVTTYTETRKLMHCNFGWEGTANGYYLSEVFKICDGQVELDPVIDEDVDPASSSDDWNPSWWWRIVVYNL